MGETGVFPEMKHSRNMVSGQSEYLLAGGNRNC